MAGCQPWCTAEWNHDACTRYTGSTGEVSVGLIQHETWPAPAVQISYGQHVHVFVPVLDTGPMAALMHALGHPDLVRLIHLAVMDMHAREPA